ncbi:MAG: GatB/YqeY domain-containing protein [Chitinophagaceae bacterium]|nr:GatB/YqeY domain-containing protein [Rubrivivax sp.]
MSLKERITEDMKTAMRAKDAERLSTIRMLLAAMKQREVDERIVLDDAAVVGIVDKLVKQRKDSVTAFTQGGRMDLADKESAEIKVLEGYLPQRLSAAEVHAAVAALVIEIATELGRPPGPGEMGKVMGAAKARLAGQADMGLLSAAVKQALAPSST